MHVPRLFPGLTAAWTEILREGEGDAWGDLCVLAEAGNPDER